MQARIRMESDTCETFINNITWSCQHHERTFRTDISIWLRFNPFRFVSITMQTAYVNVFVVYIQYTFRIYFVCRIFYFHSNALCLIRICFFLMLVKDLSENFVFKKLISELCHTFRFANHSAKTNFAYTIYKTFKRIYANVRFCCVDASMLFFPLYSTLTFLSYGLLACSSISWWCSLFCNSCSAIRFEHSIDIFYFAVVWTMQTSGMQRHKICIKWTPHAERKFSMIYQKPFRCT